MSLSFCALMALHHEEDILESTQWATEYNDHGERSEPKRLLDLPPYNAPFIRVGNLVSGLASSRRRIEPREYVIQLDVGSLIPLTTEGFLGPILDHTSGIWAPKLPKLRKRKSSSPPSLRAISSVRTKCKDAVLCLLLLEMRSIVQTVLRGQDCWHGQMTAQ